MEQEQEHTREQFLELVKAFSHAMLVTHSLKDALRARPMSVAAVQDDGDLWFTSAVDSEKADELLREPRVGVVMQSDSRFVSISGDAELVVDRAKAKALWNEAWRPWFPEGPEDPKLALIRVRAKTAEYWDLRGMKGLRYVFEAVKHVITGERMGDAPTADHHAKLDLR